MHVTPDAQLASPGLDELHRQAFNSAFCELGLKWYWDSATYRKLLGVAQEDERIRAYMETHQPHLLCSYDAEFLVGLIRDTKARYYSGMIARGTSAIQSGPADIPQMHLGEVGF